MSPSLIANCTFIRPTTLQRQRQLARLPLELGEGRGVERVRRQRAGAVARVDAGLLDVLHDAGDERVLAVGEAVDVDLDGVGQIAVDQQRALVGDDELGGAVERRRQARDVAVDLAPSCTISMARPPST